MGLERASPHSNEPGGNLPSTHGQTNTGCGKRSGNSGGPVNAKYFDYLPQRASQLFFVANSVSASDNVCGDLWFLLLELAGLFRFDGHGITDARPDDANEPQR